MFTGLEDVLKKLTGGEEGLLLAEQTEQVVKVLVLIHGPHAIPLSESPFPILLLTKY